MKTMALFPLPWKARTEPKIEPQVEPPRPPPCEIAQVDLDMLAVARTGRVAHTLPGLGWRYG
ncbi:hypothetical protein LZC95_12400 [Pendulispora brunnea]|uniref:Uncharacterized protein n=1 Tax=Pendulispora brunnea TaxID=2905690 RepID=A0ABZ2KGC2_9BACT